MCSSLKAAFFLFVLFGLICFVIFDFCLSYSEVVMEFEILTASCVSMSFPIVLDWSGLFFSAAVLLVSSSVMMFSSFYMNHEVFHSRFVGLVMLFVLSMNFLIFIPSMFGLMVGWDGLGVISFLLVIFYQNKVSLGAGMITVLTNRVGDVFFILSICIFAGAGTWIFLDFTELHLSLMLIGFVIIGSMTKSAQIPFSAWLPAAMAAPTPVSALVHSSTLVTAGVFVLIRFSGCLWGSWGLFLTIMAMLTLVMAGLSASFECDFKKVIALSTLSQLGMMMLIISVGAMSLCIFHLITHALFKALMFLCAGAIIHLSGGIQDSRFFSGLWYKLPIMNSWLVVSCLSLMGVPFMAGFYSKDLILEWCISGGVSVFMFLGVFFGTLLTAFYSVRFLCLVLGGDDFYSFVYFQNNDLKLVLSSSVLGFGAILGGFVCQDLVLETNVFVFNSFMMKMSIPLSIFFGFIFSGYYFLKVLMNKKIFKLNFLGGATVMNMKMWFLPFLSGSFWSAPSLSAGMKIFSCLDSGWVESILGGVGVSENLGKASKKNSLFQKESLGVYFSIGLMFVFVWGLFLNFLV